MKITLIPLTVLLMLYNFVDKQKKRTAKTLQGCVSSPHSVIIEVNFCIAK